MKKNKLSFYLLFISIFTLITIFFFIVQKSYSNLMGPVNEIKVSNVLKPIDPHLDTSTLDIIQNRQFYSADTLPNQ
jgi:hypothetical protein